MKRILLLIAALALPSVALATPITNAIYLAPADLGVSAALLSGSPAFNVKVAPYSTLTVYVALTRAAATALTLTCTAGPTAGVQAPVGVAAVNQVTGTITMTDAVFTWTGVGSTRNFRAVLSPVNDNNLACIITGTGATSDTVSAHVVATGAR